MLQRIQSVYIFISFVLGVVSLANPFGRLTSDGVRTFDLYNLWATNCADKTHVMTPWIALFVILVIATSITFISIALFTRRATQMRVLVFAMLLLIGYYGCMAFFIFMKTEGMHFTPSVYAGLPIICIILDYFAYRGILKDILLLKSVDRIR